MAKDFWYIANTDDKSVKYPDNYVELEDEDSENLTRFLPHVRRHAKAVGACFNVERYHPGGGGRREKVGIVTAQGVYRRCS